MADILNTLVAVAAMWTAQINIPKDEIAPRFETVCTNGKWKPECPVLRTKLEVQLHASLHQLFLAGEPFDRDQLHVAARAHFPNLVEFALLRLEKLQSTEDKEAVLAALDHPSPMVRLRAWRIMDQSVDSWREGLGRWHYCPERDKYGNRAVVPLTPDIVPNMAYYGLPALNDSRFRYQYIASGERRAVYTTKLSPEEVLGLVAKGQRVTLGAQLDAQLMAALGQFKKKEQEINAMQIEKNKVQILIFDAERNRDVGTASVLLQRLDAIDKALKAFESEKYDEEKRLDANLIKTVTATLETGKAFDADPANIRYVTNTATLKPVIIAVSHDDVFGETAVVVTFPE